MTFKVEIKGIGKLLDVLRQAPDWLKERTDEHFGQVAESILETAKGLIHTRSGWLAGSGYVFRNGPVNYTVAFGASYAAAVHEGTRPHMIYPRMTGGVLRFEAGGEIVFTRYVRHPGTRAQNFLEAAKIYHAAELLQVIRDSIATWIHWGEVQA